MFVLTKREQRVVIVIILALVAITLVLHYRDVGTILPAGSAPLPEINATPSSATAEESAATRDERD